MKLPSRIIRTLGGIFDRVLSKIALQLGVEFWMTGPQGAGSLKESLGGHRKKLGGISGSVGVEKSWNSRLIGGPQRGKLGSHYFAPG